MKDLLDFLDMLMNHIVAKLEAKQILPDIGSFIKMEPKIKWQLKNTRIK